MNNKKLRVAALLAAMLCILATVGCSRGNSSSVTKSTAPYYGYIADFEFAPVDDIGVIKFYTTLPEGATVLVELTSPKTQYQKSKSAVVATEGSRRCITTDAFDNNGQPLEDGNYVVQITLNAPSSQNENIRATIGAKGELLGGANIIEKDGEAVCKEIETLKLIDGRFVD